MGLLDDALSYIDARKRVAASNIQGLLTSPMDVINQWGGQLSDNARGLLNSAADSQSVMPDVAQHGADSITNSALGAGLLAIKPVGGTWYKGMWPHDYTKETKTDPGPLINPEDINRNTPFPTFNGDQSTLDGIRGFFSSDPAVASRFAEGYKGAVYPVNLAAEESRILTLDAKGANAGDVQFGKTGKKFQDAVQSGKYDTILIKNTKDEGDIAVALKGSQISSAIDK